MFVTVRTCEAIFPTAVLALLVARLGNSRSSISNVVRVTYRGLDLVVIQLPLTAWAVLHWYRLHSTCSCCMYIWTHYSEISGRIKHNTISSFRNSCDDFLLLISFWEMSRDVSNGVGFSPSTSVFPHRLWTQQGSMLILTCLSLTLCVLGTATLLNKQYKWSNSHIYTHLVLRCALSVTWHTVVPIHQWQLMLLRRMRLSVCKSAGSSGGR